MFSRQLFLAISALAMFALVVLLPVSAQFVNPDLDDVLDNPQEYVGKTVTIEGEVDRVYSNSTFAIEDDADLFGEDHILVITVSPNATVSNLDSDDMEATVGSLKEGKLVRATGTIRMFDRTALETDFGTMALGDLPAEFDSSRPVLIIGAQERAAAVITEEETEITEAAPLPVPEPTPEVEEMDTEEVEAPVEEYEVEEPEEPAPVEEAEEEPDMEEGETLPATATGLPLLALIGLASITLGFVARRR